MRQHTKKRQNGFTLIELMIVIVIIGILATLLIPRIMERPEEARRIKAKADIKTIESALKLYKIDTGNYPTTEQGLEALIRKPDTPPIPKKWRDGGYLEGDAVPKDPWGNPYYYTASSSSGTSGLSGTSGRDYEITSYGHDGQPGGTGRDADISSVDLTKD
jgi:general secretion pathway protein G